MANRAYLYASDSLNVIENWPIKEDYFDSRWTIPFAWWFFYDASDIRMMDVESEGSTWRELKLLSPKPMAISRFQQTRSLLEKAIMGTLPRAHLDYLLMVVSQWPGSHLIVEPSQVLDGDDSDDEASIRTALQLLNTPSAIATDVARAFQHHSPIVEEKAESSIIGHAYSDLAELSWRKLVNPSNQGSK